MIFQHPFTVGMAAIGRRSVILCTCVLLISFLAFIPTSYGAEKKLLVLGDSISAGYGLSQGQGWVTLLKKRLVQQGYDYQVVNASISGETTQGGLTRLPELLRQHQPDLVLIELGGNDGLRGLPLTLMRNNLSRMIDLSQKAGTQPLLLGIQLPPNYGRRYTAAFSAIYPELAEEKQVPFVPFILEKIALYPELMQADGIHPKAQAQPQLLNNIWPSLNPLLSKAP
ncbi:arylesterase [Oceanospirillum maris]|jgi:acyl-CoA thioesterase-1|uniref:arylesterase n=1 Tax=Oceanospirillum maris TaxID=64977 RepID=UPI0003FED707|nr:arylesterase [Oceanospirillum maris]